MQQDRMRELDRASSAVWIAACTAILCLTVAAVQRSALAGGNPDAGLHLAQHWCSNCHSLEDTPNATDIAPSFLELARARGQDQSWLRAWLVAPHPQMPDFNLSREEIDNLVAYLSELGEQGR